MLPPAPLVITSKIVRKAILGQIAAIVINCYANFVLGGIVFHAVLDPLDQWFDSRDIDARRQQLRERC